MLKDSRLSNYLPLNETYRDFRDAIVFYTRPRGYKTFFMLNSIEHEIFPAH